jgi:hypothetical protein
VSCGEEGKERKKRKILSDRKIEKERWGERYKEPNGKGEIS